MALPYASGPCPTVLFKKNKQQTLSGEKGTFVSSKLDNVAHEFKPEEDKEDNEVAMQPDSDAT